MKKLLNTLFIMTPGSYLKKEGETVVVKSGSEIKLRLPIHNLAGIICIARSICSPALLGLCCSRGVAVSFISHSGRFLARVQGPTSGNVLLRREQYRRSGSVVDSALIARPMVLAKMANSRTSLQRALRDHPEMIGKEHVESAVKRLENYIGEMREETDLERIRGYEGYASRTYFQVFNELIQGDRDCFRFSGRSRRPPLDPVNALLSFVYTLVLHDAMSALESVGLDPQVGFLHRDRPGRPSLALDLMEEFRPFFADRLVLSLINLHQIEPGGFKKQETGGVIMDDTTRKTVVTTYQKRKQDEIQHPFLEEKIPLGLLFYAQALLLSRYLRGDLDGYPPFFWR